MILVFLFDAPCAEGHGAGGVKGRKGMGGAGGGGAEIMAGGVAQPKPSVGGVPHFDHTVRDIKERDIWQDKSIYYIIGSVISCVALCTSCLVVNVEQWFCSVSIK